MTHPEHSSKTPRTMVGFFATLGALLRSKGGGAPAPRRPGSALIFILALFALAPSAASAGQARLFGGSFGAATSTPANPYPLTRAESVAVDQSTHDFYVSEPYPGRRVEKFDSTGHFILMFGKGVNMTAVENPLSSEAERNVCTAASGNVCQGGSNAFNKNATPLEEPAHIAVDNAPGGEGNVYVTNDNPNEGGPPGLVDKFDSSGHLIESWASAGQLDGSAVTSPPAPIAGPFSVIGGIAVDPAGNLWVVDSKSYEGHVFEFHRDGSFIIDWKAREVSEGIAVDSEDDVYLNPGRASIEKYSSTGAALGVISPSKAEAEERRFFGGLIKNGLVVDPVHNELYIDGTEEPSERGVVLRFDSSCHPAKVEVNPQPGCAPAETFGAGLLARAPQGLAIDPSTTADTLYVADGEKVTTFAVQTVPDVVTTAPAGPTRSSATLTGTINPSGVELNAGLAGCRFEWGETTGYGHEVPCEESAAEIGKGSEPVAVKGEISGLSAGHTYHYRLVAGNANDVNGSVDEPSFGLDSVFGPPVVESASAVSVTATGAELQAQVDPNGLGTRVRIEYGTQAGVYTGVTSVVEVGAAVAGQAVPFGLSGLAADTVYYYRAAAENALGEGPEAVTGLEGVFTTQKGGGVTNEFALLDGRGWELVSQPDKRGALINPLAGQNKVQAAASGDAITYETTAPTEAQPAGNAFSNNQVLSSRSAGGWGSLDISLPHKFATGTPLGFGSEYRFFSEDLSRAIVQPTSVFIPQLSPEATEETAYLHTDFDPSGPPAFCASSCYRPLVSPANVPSGTVFGDQGNCPDVSCGPEFQGATADASHVVLGSEVPLTEEAAPAGALYEWSAGQLALVSVLPPAEGGGAVAGRLVLGERGTISPDGSRVLWTDGPSGEGHLYLRDTTVEATIRLDVVQGGSGAGPGNAIYQAASSDGSVVFFTDTRRLTEDSGAGTGKPDLYRCQIVTSESGTPECVLTDLTPESLGEAADVQGVTAASSDGSYVYFGADGRLASEANARGEVAAAGQVNLYVSHEGAIRLVAVSEEEPARVSPNGRWLAFMSQRRLTGYDNRDAVSGTPDQEVFLYRAPENLGTEAGALVCASCNPTGARPYGIVFHGQNTGLGSLVTRNVKVDGGVAASVPVGPVLGSHEQISLHQPRYLSDSGRLFFDSSDALVAQDTNGVEDVYEYEPPAGPEAPVSDACTAASPTYGSVSGGCVDLLSSGQSDEESAFLDASENGDDAFFITAAQISPRDTDTSFDVYDARVGGGEPEPVKPVECQGDACQGFVEAPNDPTPGSLTFQGPGNLKPLAPAVVKPKAKPLTRAQKLTAALRTCKKKSKKQARTSCEASARKKYSATTKQAKKADNKRRTK